MSLHKLIQTLVMMMALVCLAGRADAGVVVVSGVIDGTYPTWNRISDRPDGLGGYLASANTTMPYEVLEIRTSVVRDTLSVAVTNSTTFDSFLALYSSFNPAAPLSNILAADDDSGGYPHALLTKTGLAANTSYFLVISSYANAANSVYPLYGSYSLTLGGSFTVVPKVTTTTVSASPNPAPSSQVITLTATISKGSGIATPTGTVTFMDGVAPLGSSPLNASGQAALPVSSLSSGTHSITAVYGGETKYAASTSVPVTVTVVPPPVVSGISPSSGSSAGETPVIITGSNFTTAIAVYFNSTPVPAFTVDSATQITAYSPAGVAGLIANITVTTLGGTSATSIADQFTYLQDQARNVTTGVTYLELVTALSTALSGAEIRIFDAQMNGAYIVSTSLSLRGGWDATFLSLGSQPTTLNGSLTVQSGNSSAETVAVKGKLTVKGGSLKVNNVIVL